MNTPRADFVAFDQAGRLVAIAEAKKRSGANDSWAEAWFRNFANNQPGPLPPYILLATPSKLYLWKDPQPPDFEPTAVLDSQQLFARYLRVSTADPAQISPRTFEFVVGSWLNDVSHQLWQPTSPEESHMFAETGLFAALQNARVIADIAA